MQVWGRFGVLLVLGLVPFLGHAAVRAELADGKPLVKVEAEEVVAWPLGGDRFAVLALGRGEAEVASGVRGVVAEVAGAHGVILQGVGNGQGWNVVRESNQWLLRPGKSNGENLSAVLLRDGWWFDGERVAVRRVSLGGEDWQVGAVRRNAKLEGAVLGAVRRLGSLPMGNLKQVSLSDVAAVGSKGGVVPVSDALAKLEQPKPARGKVVPIFAAEAIEPMAGPVVVSESLDFDSYSVYVPGTVVSLTVPTELLENAVQGEAGRPLAGGDEVRLSDGVLPKAEGDYAEELAKVQQVVAEVPAGGADEREVRRKLAAFYLAWQRPEEAQGVLALLPVRGDDLPTDPLARLYAGIAAVAVGREAPAAAFDQRGELAVHAKLWQAVALSAREDYAPALAAWPAKAEVLGEYPPYLRQLAQVAYARAQVMVGDKRDAVGIVDNLAAKYAADGGVVPTEILKLQGLVRLGTDDESKGLEYLAKATESGQDLAQAARARYEFVMALHQRKDLADAQLRNYLEELSLDWRGDALERDVLAALADLYDRAGEPREALERWRLMVRLFSDGRRLAGRSMDMNSVTERMAGALLNVFDPENPRTYDPLTMLGIYYDFRELVPNDARGDRVNEQVARMLTDKTLWARAMPLLEQQLEYRPLEDDARGRQVLLLAEVLRRQGKAADALKLLDKWNPVANTQVTSRNWTMAEARVLMDLKRFESVRRTLAELVATDREAAELSLDAAWDMGAWPAVVAGLQQELEPVTAAQLEADKELQLKVLRLGYALGQQKDGDGLVKLEQRYADALARLPEIADGLNAVGAATGVVVNGGTGSLAPLSKALADLSSLSRRVEDTRAQMARAAAAQAEYDAKMRYMELLPPPSL
ncbi:MAG: hypothetical protein EBR79_01515 [Proteobacteria bacterium]|nr:hypothetical protein [Pseudomonadota bacterium]